MNSSDTPGAATAPRPETASSHDSGPHPDSHDASNGDGSVPWQSFDPQRYLDANYRTVLDADRDICHHLAHLYGGLAASGRRHLRVLDVGTGPNLYPLIAALPVAASIDCGDFSQANNAYLATQLRQPSAHWSQFAEVLADVNPLYRGLPWQDLLARKVRPRLVDIYNLPPRSYDVVSSFFVAESITSTRGTFGAAQDGSFAAAVASLVAATAPGGVLALAFMAGSTGYATAGHPFPATPVDVDDVRAALLAAGCPDPQVVAVDALVRDGHAGMFFATAHMPVADPAPTAERAERSVEVLHLDLCDCTPEVIASRLSALQDMVHPALLAAASLVVLVDDYSARGRPNRVRKAAVAAADALVAATEAAGVHLDAVAFESDLAPAAEALVAMLNPADVRGGMLQVPGSAKHPPREVELWTTTQTGGRRYSCPAMAAAWQMCRLGVLEAPALRRLSDRPLVTEVAVTALDASYVHVESDVRSIVAAVAPPSLAQACLRRLGWVLVPESATSPPDDVVVELVPSEGDVWDTIDVGLYTTVNYAEPLPADVHLAAQLAQFYAGVDGDVVDIGAGPNLYPLMAASRARSLLAWEYAPAFCGYLEQQLSGPDGLWNRFAPLVNAPDDWKVRLGKAARVVQGGVLDLPPGSFDAASMLFVAECADGTWPGFATSVAAAVRSVRPGGRLFIAAMAGSAPAVYGEVTVPVANVDTADLRAALVAAGAVDVHVHLVDGPEGAVRPGHDGVMYAVASRPPVTPPEPDVQ